MIEGSEKDEFTGSEYWQKHVLCFDSLQEIWVLRRRLDSMAKMLTRRFVRELMQSRSLWRIRRHMNWSGDCQRDLLSKRLRMGRGLRMTRMWVYSGIKIKARIVSLEYLPSC